MLVRFAGPRLAASDDDLVPVKLRRGGRTLGGSLSWDQPQPLAAFSREGPFGDMPVPKDVTVTRQVLAEPEAGLAERTWATLADGTPLVTARQARQGPDRAVPRHRRHPLVEPAAVRQLRRDAAPHGRPGRHHRRPPKPPTRAAPSARWCRRPASSTASARSARRPRRRGRCRSGYVARATADHPPGFYGPPKDCSRSTRWRRPTGWSALDYAPLQRPARGLSGRRAAGPARPGAAGGARAARARRAGGVPPGRRHRPDLRRRPQRAAAARARASALLRWRSVAHARRSQRSAQRADAAQTSRRQRRRRPISTSP